MNSITGEDLKFKTPVRIVISSASQSGKTEKILLFLKYRSELFDAPFTRTVFFTPSHVEMTHEFETRVRAIDPSIEFESDLPKGLDFSEYNRFKSNTLFIFDDLASQIVSSKIMAHLFTAASHHSKISVIFTLQSAFMPGSFTKTIVRQCNYRLIMQDRADRLSLRYLTQHLFPDAPSNFLSTIFAWLTAHEKDPYERYLLLDMDNRSKIGDYFQVRTKIFPDKTTGVLEPIVFSPNLG